VEQKQRYRATLMRASGLSTLSSRERYYARMKTEKNEWKMRDIKGQVNSSKQ